jgi:hypothetical protein
VVSGQPAQPMAISPSKARNNSPKRTGFTTTSP